VNAARMEESVAGEDTGSAEALVDRALSHYRAPA
jgi:hypothetical protein